MTSSSSLQWRCRRGLREMDLLLQHFIEKHYDHLPTEEKKTFEQLLDESDMDIMAWIMGKAKPADKFLHIIKLISNTSPLE